MPSTDEVLGPLNIESSNHLLCLGTSIYGTVDNKLKLKRYLNFFKIMNSITSENLYKDFFKIVDRIPPSSANGTVFVIQFKWDWSDGKKFLVKVPLSVDEGDSLMYEYYVGIGLNHFKLNDKPSIFSSTYGWKICGLNDKLIPERDQRTGKYKHKPVQDLSRLLLCDNNSSSRLHLITDFVYHPEKDPKTKIETLTEYLTRYKATMNNPNVSDEEINRLEGDIITILIIVLSNLHIAYQESMFTHYDLHPGNILITYLKSPTEIKIDNSGNTVLTSVVPTIIDYGRSYINPSIVNTETKYINNFLKPKSEIPVIYEDDRLPGRKFTNFMNYQSTLFNVVNYDMIKGEGGSDEMFTSKDDQITNWINKYKYMFEGVSKRTIREYIIKNIFNKHSKTSVPSVPYDSNARIIKFSYGINSESPNKRYDFYRLCTIVIDYMIDANRIKSTKYKHLWKGLKKQFNIEYPFYDKFGYSLPCDYHITTFIGMLNTKLNFTKPSWDYWFKTSGDVAKFLYSIKIDYEFYNDYMKQDIMQFGGDLLKNEFNLLDITNMNIEGNLDKVNLDKVNLDKVNFLNQSGYVQRMFPQVNKGVNEKISYKNVEMSSEDNGLNSNLQKLLDRLLKDKYIEYKQYFDTDEKIGVLAIPVSNFFNKRYLQQQIERSKKDLGFIQIMKQSSINSLAGYVLDEMKEKNRMKKKLEKI
jgi:hypothetical protein